jgi:CHAD domain-containing protein
MRVATRRLRAALPLFNGCLPRRKGGVWVDEIRRITRSLGMARDADVQIEVLERYYESLDNPEFTRGIARLLLRLRQRREALQPDVVVAIDRFNNSGTLPEMRESLLAQGMLEEGLPFDRALYRHANDSLQPRLAEFLGYDSIVRLPERVTELHAMRIAAKRLRYTMETFAPLYANGLKSWLNSIRDTQETLGSIHDCDVWGTFLPAWKRRTGGMEFYGTLAHLTACCRASSPAGGRKRTRAPVRRVRAAVGNLAAQRLLAGTGAHPAVCAARACIRRPRDRTMLFPYIK